mgnify:FL=1
MFRKKNFFNEIRKALKGKKIPRIDLHNHTTWIKGKDTVVEMYKQSIKKNIKYFLFSNII